PGVPGPDRRRHRRHPRRQRGAVRGAGAGRHGRAPLTLALAPGAGVTRLVLIRHAEPDASVAGRCHGRLDVELSPRGVSRAAALDGLPLSAIYASTSRRALSTARSLAARRSLEVHPRDDLREIDFGLLEGLTYDEIAERYPSMYAAWMTDPTSVTFPGGESL